jgi:hypothetical protein
MSKQIGLIVTTAATARATILPPRPMDTSALNLTPHPLRAAAAAASTRLRVSTNALMTYAGLIAIMCAVKVLFLVAPHRFPLDSQAGALSWSAIAIVTVGGVVGLAAAQRVGVADMWDPTVTGWQRFGLPSIEGLVYGVVTVLVDLASPVNVHLALPASIPFYLYGAIFLEIVLRLTGVSVLTWVLWHVAFRKRWRNTAFWIAAVLVALYEPMNTIPAELARASRLAVPGILVGWAFRPLFLANVLTGYLYRRFGFLSAVVLRVAFYAVWHMLYGGMRSA